MEQEKKKATDLGKDIVAGIGDDGRIVLGEPTNEEWRAFYTERYPVKQSGVKNHGVASRANLFDKKVKAIEKLVDHQGPLTLQDLDRFPLRHKSTIVFQAFESDDYVAITRSGLQITARIGDDGLVVLREPTNREWNEFDSAKTRVRRNKVSDHSLQARVEFFDLLVTKVENLCDGENLITLETKDLIRIRHKAAIIFQAFETDDEIDVKN